VVSGKQLFRLEHYFFGLGRFWCPFQCPGSSATLHS